MPARLSIDKRKFLKSFLVKAVLMYVLWQLMYVFFIRPNGVIDEFLTRTVVVGTTIGLNLLNFSSHYVDNIVYINDVAAVRVENQCNGLELIALYIGFIVCFPGQLKYKVIFSLIGSAVLFLTNIIREILLALNYIYFNQSFELNHKYTYTIIVYAIVFLLWKFWVERFSVIAKDR